MSLETSTRATAPIVNAMTIDVEDYFQVSAFDHVVPRSAWAGMESRVSANTDRLLDLFAARGVRATFFVLGWIADRHGDLIRRIAAAGHELASHGYGHQLVYHLSVDAFREDVRRAKGVLEALTGRAVCGYRAPSYSITRRSLWALDVLAQEGHTYDSSIFPVRHDRYGVPDAPRHPYIHDRAGGSIAELPPSTVRVGAMNLPVAGGGYFRLLPYRWTRWGIDRINRHEHRPAVFYLHPWELDAEQPRLPVWGLSRIRHYRHLDRTEGRLRQLLKDFSFGTAQAVVARVLDVPVAGSAAQVVAAR